MIPGQSAAQEALERVHHAANAAPAAAQAAQVVARTQQEQDQSNTQFHTQFLQILARQTKSLQSRVVPVSQLIEQFPNKHRGEPGFLRFRGGDRISEY